MVSNWLDNAATLGQRLRKLAAGGGAQRGAYQAHDKRGYEASTVELLTKRVMSTPNQAEAHFLLRRGERKGNSTPTSPPVDGDGHVFVLRPAGFKVGVADLRDG